MHKKKVRVIDTTALLTWHIPLDNYTNFTTEGILKEIKKSEMTKAIIESYILSGNLVIRNPSQKYLEKARDLAIDTGDLVKLSKQDLEIIALGLELLDEGYEVQVVTDDYSIQNVLKGIGIEVVSYFRKIKKVYNWILVCEKCGEIYPADYPNTYCEKCGGRIIRR